MSTATTRGPVLALLAAVTLVVGLAVAPAAGAASSESATPEASARWL